MIIALAGRRIDAPDAATPRFPRENIEIVRRRLRTLFETHRVTGLVSSAACGADLLALEEAGALGIRRRIILPFGPERFRAISVIDRPGDWGSLYDHVVAEVRANEDLVTLATNIQENEAYAAANHAILDEAISLARQSGSRPCAVLVWDGHSRGESDLTNAFGAEARHKELAIFEVKTV